MQGEKFQTSTEHLEGTDVKDLRRAWGGLFLHLHAAILSNSGSKKRTVYVEILPMRERSHDVLVGFNGVDE